MGISKAVAKRVRNGEIDFWKFICSIIIVVHHSYKILDEAHYYYWGALCVDFFFIVTGFLLASSIFYKNQPYDRETIGQETSAFIFKKYKTIGYYFLFAIVFSLSGRVFRYGLEKTFLTPKIFHTIFDFFMLNQTGLPSNNIINANWYLSAMFIGLFIIYPIFRKNKNTFVHIIAPLAAVLIYGCFTQADKAIIYPKIWHMLVKRGVFRAIAGFCAGAVAYRFAQLLKNCIFAKSKYFGTFLSFVGLAAMIVPIIFMYVMKTRTLEMFVIFCFFIAMIIIGSQMSSISKRFNRPLFQYLGKLSTAIYLCHLPIIQWVNFFAEKITFFANIKNHEQGSILITIVFVVSSILLAMLCIAVCDPIIAKLEAKIAEKKKNLAETEVVNNSKEI